MEDKKINIPEETLKAWKDEFKKLYKTTLSDGTILIWRRMKRKEYKEIMKKFDNIDDHEERIWGREEAVCKACILYPDQETAADIIEYQAGVATVLADDIYTNSGFSIQDKTVEI